MYAELRTLLKWKYTGPRDRCSHQLWQRDTDTKLLMQTLVKLRRIMMQSHIFGRPNARKFYELCILCALSATIFICQSNTLSIQQSAEFAISNSVKWKFVQQTEKLKWNSCLRIKCIRFKDLIQNDCTQDVRFQNVNTKQSIGFGKPKKKTERNSTSNNKNSFVCWKSVWIIETRKWFFMIL